MIYTILSATFANKTHTAAIIQTAQAGAVAVSEIDTPGLWSQMQESGIAISEFTAPPEYFPPLSPWQVRQVLNITGHRSAIEAMVSRGSIELQDAWRYASEFQRDNDLLNQMTAAMGMTPEQVDDLFRLGATLQSQSI